MDAKQAIEFLRETARECLNNTYSKEFSLAVETLAKALEWQPMETCPRDKNVLLKHSSGSVAIFKYYGNGKHSVYIGWKEIES